MWKLSKLEIKGFKSFAEPSELTFPDGITAVVGPNGCGKSNISDAIVWALGEQSTKALRARRMMDVIFQGTADRQPRGLAEVSLHLTRVRGRENGRGNDNGRSDHPVTEALPYQARPGTSGNGTGTNGTDGGDGDPRGESPIPDALGVASNGASDVAVSDDSGVVPSVSAADLRLADEETDELVITRRLYRSGDSQYLMDGEQCLLRDIRERLLGTGLGTRACFTIEQGKIDQILSASPVERRGPIEEAAGVTLYRRRRHKARLKLEGTAQDLARVDDICSEVERQMRSLKRQAGKARRYKEHRSRLRRLERRWYRHAYAAAVHRVRVAEAAVAGARAAELTTRERLDDAAAAWEEARQELRRRRSEDENRRQALYKAQVENERLKAEAHRLDDRAAFGEERLDELEDQLEELRRRREETEELLERRTEAAREAEAAMEAAREDLEAARERYEAARPEANGAAAGDPEGEEAAAEDGETGDPPTASSRAGEGDEDRIELELRSLRDSLRFTDGAGDAVRLALGSLLRAPLLDDAEFPLWLAACVQDRHLVRALRRGAGVDVDRPAADGIVGRLVDRIEVDSPVAAEVLEGLLAGTWLVEGADPVPELAAAHPGHAFVDEEGTCWARGPEVRVRGRRAGDEIWNGDRYAVQRRVRARRDPGSRVAASSGDGVEGGSLEEAGGTQHGTTREDGDPAIGGSRHLEVDDGGQGDGASGERLAELERQRERARTTYRAARAQARAMRQELDSAERTRGRIDEELNRTKESIDELRQVVEVSGREAAEAREGAAAAAERCARLEQEVDDRAASGVAAEARVAGLEAAQSEARRGQERAQREANERDVAAAEARVAREHLAEQVRERLDADPEDLLRREPEEDEDAVVDPGRLRQEIADLQGKIDRLGPVNLVAYDDYLEQRERFESLDEERSDLRQAADNLETAIERIDEQCAVRFADAFQAIDGYFNRIFRQLFGGGRARMRLENPDDPLNSGIEIVAQPPGKSLQSIRLLSGGERTLVALSLMFAIFEYRPAPFCILDEADASLDEANIQRFAQALHSFQERAQFILITHNKRTMEVADLLYGVTMEESGVSKLVSVELH